MRNGIVHFLPERKRSKIPRLTHGVTRLQNIQRVSPASPDVFSASRLNYVQDDDFACFQCMFCLIGHRHVITLVLSREGHLSTQFSYNILLNVCLDLLQ